MFTSYQQVEDESSKLLPRMDEESALETTCTSSVTSDVTKMTSSVTFRILLLVGVVLAMYSTSSSFIGKPSSSLRSEENVIALAAPPVSPTTVINDYVCPKGNDYCFTSCCSDDINAKQSACPPDNYKALGFCDKCCTPSAAPTAAPVATVTAKPSFKPSGVPTTSGPTAGPSYAANDIQLSGTNQGIITPTVTGGGSMKIENNGAAVTATQTGTGRIVITSNGAAVTATNTGTGIMTIISDCIGAVTVTRTGNGATNVVATGVAAITYTLTGDGDATYPNQL